MDAVTYLGAAIKSDSKQNETNDVITSQLIVAADSFDSSFVRIMMRYFQAVVHCDGGSSLAPTFSLGKQQSSTLLGSLKLFLQYDHTNEVVFSKIERVSELKVSLLT